MYNEEYSVNDQYYEEMNEMGYENPEPRSSRHKEKYEKYDKYEKNDKYEKKYDSRQKGYDEYRDSSRQRDKNRDRREDTRESRKSNYGSKNYDYRSQNDSSQYDSRQFSRNQDYDKGKNYEREYDRKDKNYERDDRKPRNYGDRADRYEGFDRKRKFDDGDGRKRNDEFRRPGDYRGFGNDRNNRSERQDRYPQDRGNRFERNDRREHKDFDRRDKRDYGRDSRREQARKERQIIKGKNFKNEYKYDFAHRATLFDLAPPGYEDTTVEEYKRLKAMGSLPVMAIPQGSTIIIRARRLNVENIPEGTNPDDLIEFINQECADRNLSTKPGLPAALALDVGHDGTSAYIEFRTAQDCNNALELDGVEYQGQKLSITKPNDFIPTGGYYHGCPQVFQDTLNKLFVACIPIYLSDDQVRDLLCAFGELKAFNLVKDGANGLSKGYCFCEYRDGTVTDIAISGLNGMQIADKKLVVQRAVLGSRAGTNLGGIIPSFMQVPGIDPDHIISHDLLVTEVLCLINCLTANDLADDQEYQEIVEDVKQECEKYGEIVSIEIPRPDQDKPDARTDNLGKIFVQFKDKENCKEAHEALAGRKFKDRLVITTFYDIDKFLTGDF